MAAGESLRSALKWWLTFVPRVSSFAPTLPVDFVLNVDWILRRMPLDQNGFAQTCLNARCNGGCKSFAIAMRDRQDMWEGP